MVNYQVKISKEARRSLKEFYNWLKENQSELVASKVREGLLIVYPLDLKEMDF